MSTITILLCVKYFCANIQRKRQVFFMLYFRDFSHSLRKSVDKQLENYPNKVHIDAIVSDVLH